MFTLTTDTYSLTHDLMDCSCDKDVENEDKENDIDLDDSRVCQLDIQTNPEQPITINQLLRWKHYNHPVSEELLKVKIILFFYRVSIFKVMIFFRNYSWIESQSL